jgi:predicted ATPase
MRLREVYLDEFKNLRQFRITFNSDRFTTVLVGQNGTGKSNLLEALVLIFKHLDLKERAPFTYSLMYELAGDNYTVEARIGQEATVQRNGDTLLKRDLSPGDYLPTNVFGYYSGPSNRFEAHFDKHQRNFYRELLRGNDDATRRLFYARLIHSQFVLLAFFVEEDDAVATVLSELLGIQDLDSVLFVLREPPWSSKEGDPRFWYARGVVSRFLAELYDVALVPTRLQQRVSLDFEKTSRLEHLYLFLKDKRDLRSLGRAIGSRTRFFSMLESTYVSKLLSEVRIRVRVRGAGETITFRELSEGEQQLLTVLGLLRFTRTEHSLFLLDEPDTHLNPNWSIRYLDLLRRVAGANETSQVLMTTHDPLVVSGLERDEVRILERSSDSRITAVTPEDDPKGMGVAGVLTSDLFGLRSTLDSGTLALLDEKRRLAVRDHLTEEEKRQLETIEAKLADINFTSVVPDPLYQEFVAAMTKAAPVESGKTSLTPEERKQRESVAVDIVKELLAEDE